MRSISKIRRSKLAISFFYVGKTEKKSAARYVVRDGKKETVATIDHHFDPEKDRNDVSIRFERDCLLLEDLDKIHDFMVSLKEGNQAILDYSPTPK